MDKEMATTFRFIYSGLCDRLDASKESMQEMFPLNEKLQELTSKLKKGLDRINEELNKLVNAPPTAPVYETVRSDGESNSNTTNDVQTGTGSNPDEIQVIEEIVEENTSTTTTADVHSTGGGMSIEDLLKHLTLQNDRTNKNIEEVKKETKEIKQNMEKEFVDIRKEVGEIKEDTARMVDEKNEELKIMLKSECGK